MAKYIVQHRRGTASQWAAKDTIIPREGELVIEIDEENSLHKLKIGDGIHTYAELAYLMAGDEVVTQVLSKALPRVVTVEITTNWTAEADGKYSQVLALENITAYSRLDLQPDVDMLAEFKNLNLIFTTENNNGVITVYSVGNMPSKSYTMQATIVETEADCEKIVGTPIGAGAPKSGVGETTEQNGEIFNDYENNQAVSEYASTKGTALITTSAEATIITPNVAGQRAFNILAADAETMTYTLDSVEGLEVNDIISVMMTLDEFDAGTITTINTENLQVTVSRTDTTLTSIPGEELYDGINYLMVRSKPAIGTVDIGIAASTEGMGNHSMGKYTHAEGSQNIAFLPAAHVEGAENKALGYYTHAEGRGTTAIGSNSHAEGRNTTSIGNASHAEGNTTVATGHQGSHAEGAKTQALGLSAHAEGTSTIADGWSSHSEGGSTRAKGSTSHSEGLDTVAYGEANHTEGVRTIAGALNETDTAVLAAHAEGLETKALGSASHAEGQNTKAQGSYSHTEGKDTVASGDGAHSEGSATVASGWVAHAEGRSTIAKGNASHSEGLDTVAYGEANHTEGVRTIAGALNETDTAVLAAHAEGNGTKALGTASHAEGLNTKATDKYAHSEGRDTTASGEAAHAEGYGCTAAGSKSHAGGSYSSVSADGSCGFVHGATSKVSHAYSTAIGVQLKTDAEKQTIVGAYNATSKDSTNPNIFAVGNGSADKRQNAFEVLQDGRAVIQTAPADDMDVVNKAYVDEAIAATISNSGCLIKENADELYASKGAEKALQVQKKTTSGNYIQISDILPVEQNVSVVLSNENITDFKNTPIFISDNIVDYNITDYGALDAGTNVNDHWYQYTARDVAIYVLQNSYNSRFITGYKIQPEIATRVHVTSLNNTFNIQNYHKVEVCGDVTTMAQYTGKIAAVDYTFSVYSLELEYNETTNLIDIYGYVYFPSTTDGGSVIAEFIRSYGVFTINALSIVCDTSSYLQYNYKVLYSNKNGSFTFTNNFMTNKLGIFIENDATNITCEYYPQLDSIFATKEEVAEGSSIAPLMVTTDENGLATHTPAEMLEHIQKGGSVYFNDLAIVYIDENYARFSVIYEDSTIETFLIYDDKTIESTGYFFPRINDEGFMELSSPILLGDLNMDGNAIVGVYVNEDDPTCAVNKEYVDNRIVDSGTYVRDDEEWGQVTQIDNVAFFDSDINMGGNVICNVSYPADDMDAVNKAYVDNIGIYSYTDENGMKTIFLDYPVYVASELNMDRSNIINVADPINDGDATNKAYVDNAIANISGSSGLTITNRETVSIDCPQVTFDGNRPQWLHTVYSNGDEEYELLTPYTSYGSDGGPWSENTFNNMGWKQMGALAIDFSNFTHIIVSGNGNLWAEYNGERIPYTIAGFRGEQQDEYSFYIYGYGYIPYTIDNISTGYGRPEMDVINLKIKLIK